MLLCGKNLGEEKRFSNFQALAAGVWRYRCTHGVFSTDEACVMWLESSMLRGSIL